MYILIFLLSVFISSLSQTMLKKSAQRTYESALKEYLNPLVIIAYGLFFASSLITIVAYRYVPLSLGPILESAGYIFVTVLGYLFLKERISKRKIFGTLLILAGIAVYNIPM